MQSTLQRLVRSRATKSLVMAVASLVALPTLALDLVKDGQAAATIIIPDEPSAVASYAAQELQYHIEAATGARLPIVAESAEVTNGVRLYLGQTLAAGYAKLGVLHLPGNSYRVKTINQSLYIIGNDSEDDPLDLDTHEGTLFAVYDFLENNLGVRWLWPGKLGEVIPRTNTVSLSLPDATVRPLLWFKEWRNRGTRNERIWLKRQRFGRSIQPQYGHSFGNYWTRFGSTHPEYFAMLPDGTRRLDPTADPGPEWVHMCVSSAGLTDQILADWEEKGSPRFLNVCENDGWAGCVCPTCLFLG